MEVEGRGSVSGDAIEVAKQQEEVLPPSPGQEALANLPTMNYHQSSNNVLKRMKLFIQNKIAKTKAFNQFAAIFGGKFGKNSKRIAQLRNMDHAQAKVSELKNTMHTKREKHETHPAEIENCRIVVVERLNGSSKKEMVRAKQGEHLQTIEFTDERTEEAIKRLHGENRQRLGVQNCANKFEKERLGVALTGGKGTQEEAIARGSNAGFALCPEAFNVSDKNTKIHVQKELPEGLALPVIGGMSTENVRLFDGNSFSDQTFTLYSSASLEKGRAYDRAFIEQYQEENGLNTYEEAYHAILEEQIRADLLAYQDKGCETLVLAMKGCGAFGGDPVQVGKVYGKLLGGEFAAVFDHVTFACPDGEKRPSFEYGFIQGLSEAREEMGDLQLHDPTKYGLRGREEAFKESFDHINPERNEKIIYKDGRLQTAPFEHDPFQPFIPEEEDLKVIKVLEEAYPLGIISKKELNAFHKKMEKNSWYTAAHFYYSLEANALLPTQLSTRKTPTIAERLLDGELTDQHKLGINNKGKITIQPWDGRPVSEEDQATFKQLEEELKDNPRKKEILSIVENSAWVATPIINFEMTVETTFE